jgi:hypothetical protein
MKEFIFLIAIAIWAVVWKMLVTHWRRKGWAAVTSHLSAGVLGFVVALIFFGVLVPDKNEPGDAQSSSSAPAPKVAAQAERRDGDEKDVPRAAANAVPKLPVVFTGAASEGAVTAGNWPTSGTITLPISKDEKQYLADAFCFDEAECYGPKRFQRYISKRYPDIGRVQYRPLPAEASDSEIVSTRKANFFQSLYFAKQIQLANGQSLYNFMRSCSRGFAALDAAELAHDSKENTPYFDLRYFPVLRRTDTGKAEEMNIIFERRGDKLIAGSPFFTSNALRYPDFLERHKLTCWNGATKAG